MLGYNAGQVLKFSKKHLDKRYNYLLFGIQNLREAVKSAKFVMNKEKLDKQLAGQSSTPYMSFKLHHSEKCISVKFDEYKLLDNQTDRLVEVMDKMNTRPLGRQIQQDWIYKPYIHRGRGCRNYPSYDKSYDRVRGNFRQKLYDRKSKGYSSFRGRPRGYNNLRGS